MNLRARCNSLQRDPLKWVPIWGGGVQVLLCVCEKANRIFLLKSWGALQHVICECVFLVRYLHDNIGHRLQQLEMRVEPELPVVEASTDHLTVTPHEVGQENSGLHIRQQHGADHGLEILPFRVVLPVSHAGWKMVFLKNKYACQQ